MLKDADFWEEFYKEEPVDDDLLDKDMDSDADQTELLEIAENFSEVEEDNNCLILEVEPYEDLLVEDIGLRILEVDVPDDEKGFAIDSVKNLRIPGYKRNVYRKCIQEMYTHKKKRTQSNYSAFCF